MVTSISSIPSFCINLDRRLDRWFEFCDETSRVGFHPERVSAIDRMSGMSGPAACMESHRKVWGLASSCGGDLIGVFEDDATFPSFFNEVFRTAIAELPHDWKVWHLHSFGPAQKYDMVGKHVTRLKRSGWGSHGYIIKKEFAKELLALSDNVKNMPVDILLTVGMRYLGVIPYGVDLEHTLCIQSAKDTDIPESTQKKYWIKVKSMYMK